MFFQGHPEYDAISLLKEFKREVQRFLTGSRNSYPPFPEHYLDAEAKRRLQAYQTQVTESDFEQDSFQPETQDNDVERPLSNEIPPRPDSSNDGDTHSTLRLILREMQAANRENSFTEFSIAKLLAGVFQMIAVFCGKNAAECGNGKKEFGLGGPNKFLSAQDPGGNDDV